MNHFIKPLLLIAGGAVGGIAGFALISGNPESPGASDASGRKPLYWVAPMNPTYRSDKPGKSPMGMDLVPIYDEGVGVPGMVAISPDVVNNLGVRSAPVKSGRLVASIATVGYVRYNEDRLVNVDPRVEGWVEKLYVKAEGDPVVKGEPLYTFYSPTLVNAQEELLLALERNNPALIRAAEERLAALKLSPTAIQEIKKERKIKQNVTLDAPQSGVVDSIQVREGSFVKPGTRMMSIAVLDDVWVVGEVFERQLPLVSEGDPVTMTLDYLPGRQWEGRIEYIYPALDSETRTAKIRMAFANPDRVLRPGMFAQVTVHGGEQAETVLIPEEALIRTGDGNRIVLDMGEGKFKSIRVTAGRFGNDQVEILSGLRPGDRVVTSAQFLIDSESSKTSDFKRMNHSLEESASEGAAGERAVLETGR